jgi:alpha-mannosidase
MFCFERSARLYLWLKGYRWDAWDVDVFHLETEQPVTAVSVIMIDKGPLRATLEAEYAVGNSHIKVIGARKGSSMVLDLTCWMVGFS